MGHKLKTSKKSVTVWSADNFLQNTHAHTSSTTSTSTVVVLVLVVAQLALPHAVVWCN